MEGVLGGLYGIISAGGRLFFALLVGRRVANRLPKPFVAVTFATILGGASGWWFDILSPIAGNHFSVTDVTQHMSSVSTRGVHPVAGMLLGGFGTAILAFLDSVFGGRD